MEKDRSLLLSAEAKLVVFKSAIQQVSGVLYSGEPRVVPLEPPARTRSRAVPGERSQPHRARAVLPSLRAQVREATGYDDLQDVIDLFERYEEEKFAKVSAAAALGREASRGGAALWRRDTVRVCPSPRH